MVNSVAFAPDGATIASGGHSGKVTLWSAAGEKRWEVQCSGPVCSPVYSVAFAPDGATIASGGGHTSVDKPVADVRNVRPQSERQPAGLCENRAIARFFTILP